MATYTVGRGDLAITASGSGTLIPASEIALGFRSSGTLSELLVEVGDRVEAGDVLARLDDTDAQDQLAQAQINLRQAELNLTELTEEVDAADLASAQASLSSAKADLTRLTEPPGEQDLLAAQENLKSAQEALAELKAGPDEDLVEIAEADLTLAEMNLRNAQTAYDRVAHRENVGTTQQALDLWQATTNYEKALAEYNETLEGATADEISDARSKVAQAQAQLDALLEEPDADEVDAAEAKIVQAQAQLDNLLGGASAKDLETAQLNVTQAELNLQSALRQVEETELVTPVSGTVTEVGAKAGESVGTSAFVTLADLDQPQVQFWVEESDLMSVAPGNAVSIVFEALPDYTYPGTILSVDPVLVTVDGTPAVQSYASIDLTAYPVTLLAGMNADVEVTAGEARNAVLVPLQALRELGPESFAVFVVGDNDELEMRIVTVGLKDFVNA
ncbi:MAG: HlyD family efflux transporter periplasmic adaptor subunit, partial [Gammaproteobacteria bacterium]|nr:HlyD family efflux transporter periplasmic adaptor subunit [Gammaproteobacteria bacterium]